jgi:HK97 family phage prohead protease
MDKQLKGRLEQAEGKYRIVASTGDVDRDNERIMPSAFAGSLPAYLDNNPVILWAHDYSKPPVGKAIGGNIDGSGLYLDIEFADTEFAREVKYLYDNGFMSSCSVGFIPKQWDRDRDGRVVFTDAELLETSAVPVPANSNANIMRALKSAGFDKPHIADVLEEPARQDAKQEPKKDKLSEQWIKSYREGSDD